MKTLLLPIAVLASLSPLVHAAPNSPGSREIPIVVAEADQTMTEGEVRKVDRDAKKITLRHGEIANLGMPAMSMVFQVSDPAFIDKVKPGDKVRFRAEKANGSLVVTRIELAN